MIGIGRERLVSAPDGTVWKLIPATPEEVAELRLDEAQDDEGAWLLHHDDQVGGLPSGEVGGLA